MASSPIVFPPVVWNNQDIVLYHGTVDSFASVIETGRILVRRGRTHTDFGPGFYTTTSLRQAHTWAADIAARKVGAKPAVIQVTIGREHLAQLETLTFVRGDFDADDFWSLGHHCRKGATDHGRARPKKYYDLVCGPVASFWNQRMTITDADQISFHTCGEG
jgi:Protein of unknown function (DUF3990)